MIKQVLILGLIVVLASTQTTVTPKTQACACANLLSSLDCLAKTGCTWTFATATNSTTNTTTTSTTQGTCANSTVIVPILPTYCLNVTNVTLCAQTIGCAFLNNTCQIFTGCSAYVQSTNAACQTISTQCTTDGTRCVPPTACSTYTTQSLCSGNLATSGAKSCTWTASGTSGTCADKVCSDAPTTLTTQSQCTGWIAGCLTTGKGCATVLGACSSYTQASGCSGMIGSDGPCTANTAAGSTVCRPLVCSDAATTLATNTVCSSFLTGCVTSGKGCASTLPACSSYTQTQGCTGLIGSDGPCTANTTAGSTACRALACSDAPLATSTIAGCTAFLAGCVTNGQGCTNNLGSCSSYTGTTTTCSSYIGTDGNCKGTSATAASCSARTCADAPTTTNTNAACAAYQTGCLTNGFGCVTTLGLCSSYTGTNTTCTQYIGSDGNCTAPSSQTTAAACSAKVCSQAPSSTNTNFACQAYSYLCVTNGNGCVAPTTCEATPLAITCQGQSSCSSNQICLNRSQCANYLNQSQCLLNQQQYQSGGTIYLRACTWAVTCSNQTCSSLSTSFSTDAACTTALAGCLTKGSGCVDVNDGCGSYAGLTAACLAFKGVNGTELCTQLNTVTDASTVCVARTSCSQAKTYSLASVTQSSNTTCSAYKTGCFFDGKDNCTNGDCTSYFGTQIQCGALTTALNDTTPQSCWKTSDLLGSASACEVKVCTQATGTSFLTNAQCNAFLTGCVWSGSAAGGCVAPNTLCASYSGTPSACAAFQESGKVCTKTAGFCGALVCTNKTPPSPSNTSMLKGTFCQGFTDSIGYNCQMGSGATCVQPSADSCASFVAIGADNAAKAAYCQNLILPGTVSCGYSSGENCTSAACNQFTAYGPDFQRSSQCQLLKIDGTIKCGLSTQTATQCSLRACTDFGPQGLPCLSYSTDCSYHLITNICYLKAACSSYTIPDSYTATEKLKAQYCSSLTSVTNIACTYLSATSQTTCSIGPANCQLIGTPASISNDQDKAEFCVNSKKSNGQNCAFSSGYDRCEDPNGCDQYFPYQGPPPDNLVSQTFCQTLKDTFGYTCGYTGGQSMCRNPRPACAGYNTYGTTIAQNQSFCSKLSIYSNILSYCSSNTAGTSNCKDFVCGDLSTGQSISTCSNYNNQCQFDGQQCVLQSTNCSDYTAQSAGQGQLFNCLLLRQTDGKACGWNSGSNCALRTCSQKTDATSRFECHSYLQGCQYNGSACVATESACTSYIPTGTDLNKSNICNAMFKSGNGPCTYMVGTNTCIDAVAACAYNKPASATTDALATAACLLAQDNSLKKCGYTSGAGQCSPKTCAQFLNATLDSDCISYLQGCDLDKSTSCASTVCTKAPTTFTTNAACATFRSGCITNGAGCVETTAVCSDFKGTQAICNGFTGNGVPCTNTSTAGAADACINKTCALNTTAKSNQECSAWYPPTSGVANCVWGGTSGCVSPQLCAQFTGTIDTCPTFTASNGPCYGTGTVAAPAPCAANTSNCTAAPATFNTDAQCKTWGSTCMTNGFGCISTTTATCSSILSPLACPLYKSTAGLFCDLASQCKTKPSTCAGFSTASECNNTPLVGSTQITCAWNAASTTCVSLTCALLPVTLITDGACSAIISTCTTNGAGCITKGACSIYPKLACGPAPTTDTQKACIWSNSVCRPIQCTDNTSATSDAACNTYLAGCRTTGTECVASLTCSVFTNAALCLFDSTGYPCLWYKASATAVGTCMNYAQCTDVIQSTHSACQAASTLCTTNGTNCIAITGCSRTVLQASCIIGTDGNCGWLPAAGSTAAACALFTNCSAATGTTTAQCSAWGSACISNGTTCLSRSTCSAYTTQIACGNAGTEGTCFWVVPTGISTTGTCRLQLCSDATTNLSTHTGCVAFQAQTACTTSGTACISQATCSSYSVQAGCVQGTDGVCFWATTSVAATNTTAASTSSVCRLKLCTDSLLTSSALCATAITGIKCVSNGVNCIPQSTCSTYTAREACLGGGSDGACAFIPGTNSSAPNVGTCAQFSSCQTANSDQTACNSRSDACYFNSTTTNGTTTSSCSPHTCATKALGSSCQPVASWDLSTYQICVLTGTTCAAGSPTSFTASSCYSNSVGTHSWSANSSSCTACVSTSTPNTTNNTVNNTNNTYGYIISIILSIALFI